MACICGHGDEAHSFQYGQCEAEGCNCPGYEPDLIDLLERYKRRARDNEVYIDPFLPCLCFLIDVGYLTGRDNTH